MWHSQFFLLLFFIWDWWMVCRVTCVTSASSILQFFSWGICSHRLFSLVFHTVSQGEANLVMDRSNLWSQEESFSLVVLLLLPPSAVCQLRLSFDLLNRYHLRIKPQSRTHTQTWTSLWPTRKTSLIWGEMEEGVWACSRNKDNTFSSESVFMLSYRVEEGESFWDLVSGSGTRI